MTTTPTTAVMSTDDNEQQSPTSSSSFFDIQRRHVHHHHPPPQVDSLSSSCSSSPPTSMKPVANNSEIDSGCGSDEDPALALKINKGLSMGYDYELIKSVIQQQNDGDDMSKFIETIVRTAEVTGSGTSATPTGHNSPSSKSNSPTTVNNCKTTIDLDTSSTTNLNCSDSTTTTTVPHDVYIVDGADLAYSYGNNSFSWRGIEICIKYLHSHGHKKVFVALPYSLKHHRHDSNFLESKALRDLERKNMLFYTNRMSKQTNKPGSHTHISEMLKFSQKTKGHLITNVSLKDVILDFTVYKHILEERVIRYRYQNDNFQPLLVAIVSGDDGNDCETHYPLCPYGKKCTYGSKCKYFHIERRFQSPLSVTESLLMKARLEKSKMQHHLSNPSMSMQSPMMPVLINNAFKPPFNHTKSGPDQLRMFGAPGSTDRHSPPSFFPQHRSFSPVQQPSITSNNGFFPISTPMEQSLVDDARAAYDCGLSSSDMNNGNILRTNDFSFIDQRVPIQSLRQSQMPTQHHSWFGSPNQQYPFLNRPLSMPPQPPPAMFGGNNDSQRLLDEQQQQMAAAMLMHHQQQQQQQQNWARQQSMFSQQQPQQLEQNVLQLLSMLSMQQQQNNNNTHLPPPPVVPMVPPPLPPVHQQQQQQQENQRDLSSVNSQQGLADKIQAVRHLWESENQCSASPQVLHQMTNYIVTQQQAPTSTVDSLLYAQMVQTLQQQQQQQQQQPSSQGFVHYQ